MKNRSTVTPLDLLVRPLTKEVFLKKYWIQQRFVGRGSLSRFSTLSKCKTLHDIDSVLDEMEARPNKKTLVRAWFQDEKRNQHSATIDATAAKALYRSGDVTIVIDDIEFIFPFLKTFMDRLEGQLTTSMPSTGVNLYASPKGAGSVMHFDQQEVFLLQIKGRKQWKIAPNQHIKYPTESHFGGIISEENKMICSKLPKHLPKDHETLVLKPGSVLYLPRGYWHQSLTIEDSLALTLTFPSTTWIELILKNLRERLVVKEKWRTPAFGVEAKGSLRKDATNTLQHLLLDLKKEVDGLT